LLWNLNVHIYKNQNKMFLNQESFINLAPNFGSI